MNSMTILDKNNSTLSCFACFNHWKMKGKNPAGQCPHCRRIFLISQFPERLRTLKLIFLYLPSFSALTQQQNCFRFRVLWKKTYFWRILRGRRNGEKKSRSDSEQRDDHPRSRFLELGDMVAKWRKAPWALERAFREEMPVSVFHLFSRFKFVKRESIDIRSSGEWWWNDENTLDGLSPSIIGPLLHCRVWEERKEQKNWKYFHSTPPLPVRILPRENRSRLRFAQWWHGKIRSVVPEGSGNW